MYGSSSKQLEEGSAIRHEGGVRGDGKGLKLLAISLRGVGKSLGRNRRGTAQSSGKNVIAS